MELQSEKAVWKMQSILGLDFDCCTLNATEMVDLFRSIGKEPFLVYHTFSNDPIANGGESYRLLWKVDIDLNLTYQECSAAIQAMRRISLGNADKFCCNPTRLFQGCNSGAFLFNPEAHPLNLRSLSS
jgi:hypothetical protein